MATKIKIQVITSHINFEKEATLKIISNFREINEVKTYKLIRLIYYSKFASVKNFVLKDMRVSTYHIDYISLH